MILQPTDPPTIINLMDDAMWRVGIAFRVQADVDSDIIGLTQCTSFLNRAALLALQELCVALKSFNGSNSYRLLLRTMKGLPFNVNTGVEQRTRTSLFMVSLQLPY